LESLQDSVDCKSSAPFWIKGEERANLLRPAYEVIVEDGSWDGIDETVAETVTFACREALVIGCERGRFRPG
jgi:hypothetical protein